MMKKRILLSFLIVCFVLPVSVSADDTSESWRKNMNAGVAAARNKDWQTAIKYLEAARKTNPNVPEILMNLALVMDKKGGQPLKTIAWYQAYLASRPDAPNASQVKARIAELKQAARQVMKDLIDQARETLAGINAVAHPGNANLALSSIAGALAVYGDISGAEAAAQKLTNNYFKADALGIIAQAYMDKDMIDQGKRTLARAWDLMNHKIDFNLYDADRNLIRKINERADDERYDDIISLIEAIENKHTRARVYADIAQFLAGKGKIEKAFGLVPKMTAPREKARALAAIAEEQAKNGDFSGAKKTAGRIGKTDNYDALAFADIAKEYAAAGQLDEALKTVDNIRSDAEPYFRAMSYANIAYALADHHDDRTDAAIQKSLVLIPQVRDKNADKYKARTYLWVAQIQIKSGDSSGALDTLELAARLIAGMADPEQKEDKNINMADLAWLKAKAGDIIAAEETIGAIEIPYYKSTAWGKIYRAQTRNGSMVSARRSLENAFSAAKSLPDKNERGNAMKVIALMQYDTGDIEGAIHTAMLNEYPYKKFQVFETIAGSDKEEARKLSSTVRMFVDIAYQEYEVWDWSKMALEQFEKQVFSGLSRYIESLRKKEPHQIVQDLCGAVKKNAAALNDIEKKETLWIKRRASKI